MTVDAHGAVNTAEAQWYSSEPAATTLAQADAFTLGVLMFEVRALHCEHRRGAVVLQRACRLTLTHADAFTQCSCTYQPHGVSARVIRLFPKLKLG